MREIFALEPDVRSPTFAQSARMRKSGGTAHPGGEFMIELGLKFGVLQIPLDTRLQPIERRHQGLGNVAPAEGAVAAAGVGETGRGRGAARQRTHESFSRYAAAARAARTNSGIFAGSVIPGTSSTPVLTST